MEFEYRIDDFSVGRTMQVQDGRLSVGRTVQCRTDDLRVEWIQCRMDEFSVARRIQCRAGD